MPSTTSKPKPRHSWQFDAIGTRWSIETARPIDDVKQHITERIELFDRIYSRFRDDSLVTRMSGVAGTYEFPQDAKALFQIYRKLYEATDGAVSPLVGDVLSAAGYDRDYSLVPSAVLIAPAWDDAMKFESGKLMTNQPLLLDFGAAGKGYLVDIIAGLLERDGYDSYVVDASGDVRVRKSEQVIGLENPYDASSVIGAVKIDNASLCASATNRRAWGEWHHVVDPRTGRPVRDVAATWVIAARAVEADALATALFFVPADKLTQWDFQYVRLLADGSIERSHDFVGELYI